MPYYTGGPIGPNPDQVSLDDFRSSLGSSIQTAAEDVWQGNPTHLAVDWLRFQGANRGARLDKPTAEAQVKQAGVKLDVPESGYTAEALDMLIGRKQDETRRADILARAPTGVVPTSTRFAAQLLTGLTDPLNIAAGFIPVVGEARYASMLARAGDSLLARSGARVAAGAAEGAVGVAALEPFAYGAHQQLQDDYHFTDSLMNVAFGAALGGALHVGAGAIGDVLRGAAPHPATRYGDLSVNDIQSVMNFERQRAEMPAADQARVLETFSPEMRRALGDVAPSSSSANTGAAAVTPPAFERSPLSAAAIHDRLSPEFKASAMRSAVADMLQGRMPSVEHIVGMDPLAMPPDIAALHDIHLTAVESTEHAAAAGIEPFQQFAERELAAKGPSAEPKQPKADQFLAFLRRIGGISHDLMHDITGERGIRANRGRVFKKTGLQLDEIASRAVEAGYLSPDALTSVHDNDGARAMAGLIDRAMKGERIDYFANETAFAAKAKTHDELMLADHLERRLELLGVDPAHARGDIDVMTRYLDQHGEELASLRMTEIADEMRGRSEDIVRNVGLTPDMVDLPAKIQLAREFDSAAVDKAAAKATDDIDFLDRIEEILDRAPDRRKAHAGRDAALADARVGAGDGQAGNITSLDDVRAAAERQAAPEAVSVADFFAARAAEQQLKDAPKGEPLAAAEASLTDASERLEAVRKNLEQSGIAPEKLEAALQDLKRHDEAVNDAKSLGDAARAAALCGVRS